MTHRISYIKVIFALLFLGFWNGLSAQNPNRHYESYHIRNGRLEIRTSDGKYIIEPYSKEILETSFIPRGEKYHPTSEAVVMKPGKVNFRGKETGSRITFKTDGISVELIKSPFQISYFYKGEFLISEKKGYVRAQDLEKINFNLRQPEILMGGGARALGMNCRGHRLQLYNKAHYGYETYSELLNFTLPVVLSSEKYLLHFDNAPIGYLDLDSKNNNELTYETISGRKTYQVIAGDSWKQILDSYTSLTGKQPMPPRWALGNFASRFGYHSQEETLNTIEKFRKDSIPVDAVILDLYWFGHEVKGTMGNLEFVRDSFPRPKKMMSDLDSLCVKTLLITEPFVLTTSNKWDDAVKNKILATDSLGKAYTYDFFFGNTGLIDVFKPKSKKWFWNIYKDQVEMGVAGHWGDLGEPEMHPSDLQHENGTADEVHNIFGNEWAKLIYEGYQKDFPDKRPFILMRAGYAGAQRFGLIPWSGDVSRSWSGLKPQPEISLQMGMQGLAYMHSDLGGFAGNYDDPELYTRWLQYGVFQPVFRPHAQEDVPSEPVFKDKKTEALAREAIDLRYRLLPYNYTLVFQNHTKGWPLMRPLFFDDPDNYKLYEVSNTYLWGSDILVSPVLEKEQAYKRISFPETSNWFDFYSDKEYRKGTSAEIKLTMEHIPVFVRGGAFVTMAPLVQSTRDYSADTLIVHYYRDEDVKNSEGMVYNDDGQTPEAFKNGEYEILYLKAENIGENLNFQFDKEIGSEFQSTISHIKVVIHNMKKNAKVKMNGKKMDSEYDRKENLLKFSIENITKSTKIEIH